MRGVCLHQRRIIFSLEANCKRSHCICWQSLNHIIEIIIVKDILGDKINQNIHSPTEWYPLKSKSAAAFYRCLLQHVEISTKKKQFSRWEIIFPHISSNQWRRKRKSFYQVFFLAPSMEVPRLAAISYKRHLMNRLKHGEGIPSSALTLQGIYGSIHYSDFVGTEEVSTII